MKNTNPVRVLVVAPLGVGGVTSMMINIQKHMDRSKVNFDYLTFHDRKEPSEEIVYELGSKKLVASVDDIKIAAFRRFARLREIKKVCKDNNVQILHYNADSAADLMNIIAARAGGVKYVTIHSHNAGFGTAGKGIRFLSKIQKPLIPKFCDTYWGCSDLAARFLLPKKIIANEEYSVLPNGIELEKYKFNTAVRSEMRQKLDVEGKFVIGHAGRFADQKNHTFILDIFKCIHEKDSDAVLLLFGVGELFGKMQEKAERLGISDSTIFYGASTEMNKMWQAMDVFLMPSLHEGLPVTGIEAQASGLPCVFSSEITKEVDVTNTSIFLDLTDGPDEWADKIIRLKNSPRFVENIDKLRCAKYDIQDSADMVAELYIEASKQL